VRLRTLSEAECYVRCYGARDDQVRVLRFDEQRRSEVLVPPGDPSRWFEEPPDGTAGAEAVAA
jgi:hypothetical protein